jgi:hypothetical protein
LGMKGRGDPPSYHTSRPSRSLVSHLALGQPRASKEGRPAEWAPWDTSCLNSLGEHRPMVRMGLEAVRLS